jgi:hypothetical protein
MRITYSYVNSRHNIRGYTYKFYIFRDSEVLKLHVSIRKARRTASVYGQGSLLFPGRTKIRQRKVWEKGKEKLSFPSVFELPKRECQNNFSCLMNGEIFQAGSCTSPRKLIL